MQDPAAKRQIAEIRVSGDTAQVPTLITTSLEAARLEVTGHPKEANDLRRAILDSSFPTSKQTPIAAALTRASERGDGVSASFEPVGSAAESPTSEAASPMEQNITAFLDLLTQEVGLARELISRIKGSPAATQDAFNQLVGGNGGVEGLKFGLYEVDADLRNALEADVRRAFAASARFVMDVFAFDIASEALDGIRGTVVQKNSMLAERLSITIALPGEIADAIPQLEQGNWKYRGIMIAREMGIDSTQRKTPQELAREIQERVEEPYRRFAQALGIPTDGVPLEDLFLAVRKQTRRVVAKADLGLRAQYYLQRAVAFFAPGETRPVGDEQHDDDPRNDNVGVNTITYGNPGTPVLPEGLPTVSGPFQPATASPDATVALAGLPQATVPAEIITAEKQRAAIHRIEDRLRDEQEIFEKVQAHGSSPVALSVMEAVTVAEGNFLNYLYQQVRVDEFNTGLVDKELVTAVNAFMSATTDKAIAVARERLVAIRAEEANSPIRNAIIDAYLRVAELATGLEDDEEQEPQGSAETLDPGATVSAGIAPPVVLSTLPRSGGSSLTREEIEEGVRAALIGSKTTQQELRKHAPRLPEIQGTRR